MTNITIKKFRLEKCLTQEQLSEVWGVSDDYLSEIERGKKVPGLKRFILIAHGLGISPEKFFE